MNPEKRRKKRKFTRTIKGKAAIRTSSGKTSKHKCSFCGKAMHGMPHGLNSSEVRKLSKTQRRPEVLLAGKLCNKCRDMVVEEAIKVNSGVKQITSVQLNYRPYILEIQNKIQ